MRFALLSIVYLREVPFISLLIYQTDERGISNLIGEISKPYEDVIDLLDDLYAFEISELQTDSQELYRELMSAQYPVIYRREVEGTREQITRNEEMLVELFELDKQDEQPTPVIPTWRLWFINKLEKIIQILKTKGIILK
ncbi:hypothetical protein M5J14_23485 [Lysinibacillus sp. OL1_EC]|uniref:hypothetical protein n=1 Tax=unclassified Lysinibacillus TaxID=2636778 RepID=UPI00103AF262|nr:MULTISPECIES: hypothetical protein [unclassified Lysinibacillus]MCM0627447.1 hypothetical protein [Lysinibacillus sp. OL1_EC]TBV84795.1 hypothetical protein EW028_24055 [Lysinibacillus sp. OL1]